MIRFFEKMIKVRQQQEQEQQKITLKNASAILARVEKDHF